MPTPHIQLAPSPYPNRVCSVTVTGDGSDILQDWLGMLSWSQLPLFADCAAREVGFGHEVAASGYDDDRDPDDEPFEGVRVTGAFRDGAVVLSRTEIDAIYLTLFAMVEASAPERWAHIRDAAEVVRARALARPPSAA